MANLYPLASIEQIQSTPSREDGIPEDLEEDLRAFGAKLIYQAGILLKQKQVAVAAAQVLYQRFWYVTSMKQFGVGEIGMGALFLASKLEECPLRFRDLINVYDLLLQKTQYSLTHGQEQEQEEGDSGFRYRPMSYFGTTFYELKEAIVIAEMQILKRLGFNVQVVLPYGTLINYLRVLGLTNTPEACAKAWGYLNDAHQTPVYALYQVPTVVCAAILLASRDLNIALPSAAPVCWWELFDADWEDVESVGGYIMRLYRRRPVEERRMVLGMVTKQQVRKWLERNPPQSAALPLVES